MFWRTYYMDVVRSCIALERIRPNLYGDGMAAFVTDLSKSLGKDYEPTPFVPRKREYHPFWGSDEVNGVIEEVRALWRMFGMDFGEFPEIL